MPPLEFRKQEIAYILNKVTAGDSCSVVGVGSVGKSNLLRHFMEPETLRFHVGKEDSDNLHLVLIDPNNMLDPLPSTLNAAVPSAWAGYEIMVHRLHKAFYPLTGLGDEAKEAFMYAYDQLHDGNNPLLAHVGLRYLELALEQLLSPESPIRRRQKIVFVFDEFEEMLAQLPPRFFQALRGIRDDYKYRLMYVTFTRRPIPQIVEEEGYSQQKLEPFVELFTDNTLYLGPYNKDDATAMIERLSGRQGVNYPPSFRNFLLRASGGHAGILRASFQLAVHIPFGTPENEAMHFLATSQPVQTECRTIWDSLTEDERVVLYRLVSDQGVGSLSAAASLLQKKQLLTGESVLEISPPLFREFVRQVAVAT